MGQGCFLGGNLPCWAIIVTFVGAGFSLEDLGKGTNICKSTSIWDVKYCTSSVTIILGCSHVDALALRNVMKPLLKGFSTNCFQKTVFSSTLPILDFSFLSSPQFCFSFSANNITCSSEGIQRTVASSPNSTTPNVISTTTGTASLESTTSNGRQETFNTCLKSSSSSACS